MNHDVSIRDFLKATGRNNEALGLMLGYDVPGDRTTAIRCPNPEAHKNGDRNPSARTEPGVGRVVCSVCGLDLGLFALGVHLGFGDTEAAVAKRLDEHFRGNGHAQPGGNGKAATKTPIDHAKEFEKARRLMLEKLDHPNAGKLFRIIPRHVIDDLELGILPRYERLGRPASIVFRVVGPDGSTTTGTKRRYLGEYQHNGQVLKSQTFGNGMLGLHQLTTKPEAMVIATEGEKDLLNCAAFLSDAAHVCSSTGAGTWLKDWAPLFAGRDVVIIYDMDRAGKEGARRVARDFSEHAARVRVVELPVSGTKDDKDLSDWLEKLPDGTEADELLMLIRKTPAYDPKVQEGVGAEISDFWAYLPEHKYLFTPSRDLWPGVSVDRRLPRVHLGTDEDGNDVDMSPSRWLDKHQAVEQMTWSPGRPMIVEDYLISEGGWIQRPGSRIFNLYRAPTIRPGDPKKAGPWIDHTELVYPDDAWHLQQYLAHCVQHPGIKRNHAIVLGGAQGIGKDTILEPVKHAVGPWNFIEIAPSHLLGRFNGFAKSVVLRVSEARDLGDVNRYSFYEALKNYTAAPPDVLRVDEKHRHEHAVQNVCGVVITSNHKTDGIYLPADDRRHFVAWSELTKDDFDQHYWNRIWGWYENEDGLRHVAAYLATVDLSGFDPKAPPPKTPAFFEIVNAARAPECAELADVLEQIGSPNAVTISQLAARADPNFSEWLTDRKNRRQIPHRMEEAGYVQVRNDCQADGRFRVGKGQYRKNVVIYAKRDLSLRDRMAAATTLSENSA